MNTRTRTAARQAATLGLAAFATLSMLVSVNLLATHPAADLQMAKQSSPAQTVVIQAKRSTHG